MRWEPVNISRLRTIFAAEMPEDALQGVVHLVRNPRDELAERRELLGLREALAQRRALRLEPRLPRDVARHEHAPERVAILARERSRRQQERPVELLVVHAPLHGRDDPLPRVGRFHVRQRVGADELGQRPPHDVGPLQPHARRERLVGLDDAEVLVHDGDEVDQRVERVLQQAPLAQDVVQQLDVLDPDRQLPSQLARELEELGIVERDPFGPGLVALNGQGPERAAPTAQRGDDPRAAQLRPVQPQPAGRVMGRVVNRDTVPEGRAFRRGGQHQLTIPAVVQPDFDRSGPQNVPDFGCQGPQGGIQAQAGGDPPRKQQQKLPEALVDAHLPLEPAVFAGRI